MSGLPLVVIVRAFFPVLDETGGTLKRTAAAFVGCRQCEAAELWRQGGLNVTHAGGRQWHRFLEIFATRPSNSAPARGESRDGARCAECG